MQAILLAFAICLLGVMVTMLLFTVAMWPDEEEETAKDTPNPVAPEQFFSEDVVEASSSALDPLEATMVALQEHVRRERAAARLFLQGPTPESLHAPSDSPLWQ